MYAWITCKIFDLNEMGALVLKITTEASGRESKPWVIGTGSGIMNSVGLANPGMASVAMRCPELATALQTCQ